MAAGYPCPMTRSLAIPTALGLATAEGLTAVLDWPTAVSLTTVASAFGIAAMVSLMVNAVLFGAGLIAVLMVPALNANAFVALPVMIAGLRTAARNHGAQLFPLDGEQAPAAYATAPTGVGVL